jgi:uncharacterized protein (DUF1800 family)
MNKQQKIRQLYARAAFGLKPKDWQSLQKQSLPQLVDGLFKDLKAKSIPLPDYQLPSADKLKKLSKKEKQEIRKEVRKLTAEVNSNWVEQMIRPKNSPLVEKMALFWHGHFACESKDFSKAAQQLQTLRTHALGNFRDFLIAISKDSAMILYLNNQQNRKNKPNENYARELMELFTIGRGNYTEKDVKEAARAFTGWFTNKITGEFQFNKRQHDEGQKTFMGKSGNFDGADIIDIILEQKQTARFIARKVYRFFVNENKVEEKELEELATVFYNSGYDIKKMMRHLFLADWFYSEKHLGAKIKSPVELMVEMSRTLGLSSESKKGWLFPQRALGQVIFRPPNVAGWPGGKTWIDNSTLMLRLNFAALVFNKAEINFKPKDEFEAVKRGNAIKKLDLAAAPKELLKSFEKYSENELPKALADYLLPISTPLNRPAFMHYASQAKTAEDRIRAWTLVLMSLPEYQLC